MKKQKKDGETREGSRKLGGKIRVKDSLGPQRPPKWPLERRLLPDCALLLVPSHGVRVLQGWVRTNPHPALLSGS